MGEKDLIQKENKEMLSKCNCNFDKLIKTKMVKNERENVWNRWMNIQTQFLLNLELDTLYMSTNI